MNNTHSYINDERNASVYINIDGNLIKRSEAKISVFDSGFLLGDGVWEGIRLYNGKLAFKEEHFKRLYDGINKLEIKMSMTPLELENQIMDTINANHMVTDVHIRLIVTRGLKMTPYQHPSANIGKSTIVIIPEYKIADPTMYENGITLVSVDTIRSTPEIQDPKINSLSKFNCIQACIEAANKGGDEGLMLDINGYVSTCNSTNFFMIKNKKVITSKGMYCLNGVTRQNIINICEENNIPIILKDFKIEDVYEADAAFVTGTFAGVIPITQIDHYKLNSENFNIIDMLFKLYKQKIEFLYS
tara:strand:+ start:573 stop:1478 length:906 start_codon:yes stop_codon:yes gene_type:complete